MSMFHVNICGEEKMVNYCRKCGAELTPGNEFCGKCGERVIQKTMFIDKKRIIVQSFYLALGSIAAFIFLIYFEFFLEYGSYVDMADFSLKYFIFLILALPSAIFLIITYHGFLNSKRYARFSGLGGCILLIILSIFWTEIYYGSNFTQIILLISSIILLVLTLIFWRKLR